MASSAAISWSTNVFGCLYYSRSWLNLDGSIRCHHPRMSPVPSPHRPLLNPDWPQISHMPISIPTKQQKSPLMAFLAHGHELWWRTFERIVQKWLYSVIVIYVVGHILAIEQKLLAVSLHRLASSHSFYLGVDQRGIVVCLYNLSSSALIHWQGCYNPLRISCRKNPMKWECKKIKCPVRAVSGQKCTR